VPLREATSSRARPCPVERFGEISLKAPITIQCDLSDADTLIARLPSWFDHYNRVHPHSSLGQIALERDSPPVIWPPIDNSTQTLRTRMETVGTEGTGGHKI
jgi:hypothetical protein